MDARSLVLALLVVTTTLVGCLGDASEDEGRDRTPGEVDHAAIEAAIGAPIDLFHDHTDPTLHTSSYNLDQLAYTPLDVTLGENGFANFVFYEDDDERLALVAIDGDTDGGFTIADIADITNIEVLGSYRSSGSGFQEVRVTPDGRYALLNVQEVPGVGTGTDCSVCIHIVDITDRTDPRLVGSVPVELIGTHNLVVHEIDGTLYVFYVGQPLYRPSPVGSNPPPGNQINIARFVEMPDGSATLLRVSEYRYTSSTTDPARSFPHDLWVEQHPLTDQHILYASWWEGGAITIDVSNPALPQELDVVDDPAPSEVNAIHWFAPEPAARADGRVIGWSAPEIGDLESGTGVIRAYDLTDPADFSQIGSWTLPGDLFIPGAFLFSPHITIADMDRGLLAVSHYHAGVWILDITDPSDPRHVAYHQPVGPAGAPHMGDIWWKKPNFDPEGFLPNVYQARWLDGLLYVTERGTGLYVLEYTGPVPGSLV